MTPWFSGEYGLRVRRSTEAIQAECFIGDFKKGLPTNKYAVSHEQLCKSGKRWQTPKTKEKPKNKTCFSQSFQICYKYVSKKYMK